MIEYKAVAAPLAMAAASPGRTTGVRTLDTGHSVTAVVAVTGVRDDVGDTITPGAFARTLRERPRPKVCLGHDWNRPIGRTTQIRELLPGDPNLPKTTFDGKPWPRRAGALVARYTPDLSSEDGRNAYNSAKFFGRNESTFSIGYRTQKSRPDGQGGRHLDDLDLFEFGPVLVPANRLATLQEVKALTGRMAVITAAELAEAREASIARMVPITAAELKAASAAFANDDDDFGEPDEDSTGGVAPSEPGMSSQYAAAIGRDVSYQLGADGDLIPVAPCTSCGTMTPIPTDSVPAVRAGSKVPLCARCVQRMRGAA